MLHFLTASGHQCVDKLQTWKHAEQKQYNKGNAVVFHKQLHDLCTVPVAAAVSGWLELAASGPKV
jgi:hypothetical protein